MQYVPALVRSVSYVLLKYDTQNMTCPLHLHSVLASQTVCSFVCSQRGLMSAVAAVAMEMKESYLDWSYSTGGYKKARKTFTRLKTSHVVYSHVNLNDIRHTHTKCDFNLSLNTLMQKCLVTKLQILNLFFSCSLKENRPLSKAFFTRAIAIEKEQVCTAATVKVSRVKAAPQS